MTVTIAMKTDDVAPIIEAVADLLSRFEAKNLALELRERRLAADDLILAAAARDIQSLKEGL